MEEMSAKPRKPKPKPKRKCKCRRRIFWAWKNQFESGDVVAIFGWKPRNTEASRMVKIRVQVVREKRANKFYASINTNLSGPRHSPNKSAAKVAPRSRGKTGE